MQMKKFLMVIFLAAGIVFPQAGQSVRTSGEVKYLSGELIMKLKETPANTAGQVFLPVSISSRISMLDVKAVRMIYAGASALPASHPFANVVSVIYNNQSADPLYLCQKLRSMPEIEWIEPRYIYELSYTPNDPQIGNQYGLTKINAAGAWDISKGDTSVVIAIVDTGVDWDHPDLFGNMKFNWAEIPNNGIDDDNNGFVDDYMGWDFGGLTGTADNNPMEDRPDHGTHVAGISAAVTDNSVGVASPGFKCKWLAVKTSQDNNRNTAGQPYIVYGYEGISYAADRGAKVINCSWGGGGYSILGQQVIEYAMSKGSLVVGAAGNSNSSAPHFPSGYRGVISVASTDNGDLKSGFSNYGTTVDVSAPGSSIYNTWQNDTYAYLSGTSMASPLAAGVAGLIFAHFPGITPEQVGERLRVTGDDISANNPSLPNMLGKRVNAQKALSTTNPVSARTTSHTFVDASGDGIILSGELVTLKVNFKNILAGTSSLVVGLENKNNTATVQVTTFNAGAVSAGATFDNFSAPFTFTVGSVPANTELSFILNYLENNQVIGYEWISVIANPTYSTQAVNNISLTVTSKGTLGYNNYPTNTQGSGFKYMDSQNHLFEGALILGTGASNISDAARNSSGGAQVADFAVEVPFTIQIPGSIADAQGYAKFNDNNAGASKLGITTQLTSYAYSDSPDDDYLIVRYDLTNNSGAPINGLYAGVFFDWDMIDGSGADDYTSWDTTGSFGYTYHVGGNPNTYVGVGLVSQGSANFRGILNPGGDPGGFSVYDGFSDAEKWQSISGGLTKPSAGGGDISHVISQGPMNIAAGATETFAIAIAAGQNIQDLRGEFALARSKFNVILTDVAEEQGVPFEYALDQNYPNPFNPETRISFSLRESGNAVITVYDLLGRKAAVMLDEFRDAGNHSVSFDAARFSSGIYFYELRVNNLRFLRKMTLLK